MEEKAYREDYEKVKNLKITGEINSEDFYFMRDHMPRLTALNLKEVRIKAMCKPGEGEEKAPRLISVTPSGMTSDPVRLLHP